MHYAQLFSKTRKNIKGLDSVNATLLQKAGFIYQVMSGVYAFLPLGLRVLTKIEQIIRDEMDTLGTELLLTTLSPQELWQKTGRLETVDVLLKAVPANRAAEAKHAATYIVNPTHEDNVTPIAQQFKTSYRDLPFAVYQIQTKFRNEPRAKSGLLRGREFRMKDLYSFHATEADFKEYYERVKESYKRIFARLGLGADTVIALASGGDFTRDYSHEFQTICETGEDTLYIDETNSTAYNKEVTPADTSNLKEVRACEVGNLFPLGTRFPDAFGYSYVDDQGKQQPIYMGSYGLGSTRVMGVLVEKFHDDKGIIWPASVAPFQVYLINVPGNDPAVAEKAAQTYAALRERHIEVLWDDRDTSAGEKFADADLLGIPWRLVISQKTGDQVELKSRVAPESRLLDFEKCLEEITGQSS
jgi:prolyl-tRNA synthetase